MAATVWDIACAQKGVEIEFDEAALTLVAARGAQCRGELKTKARPLIESEYGLTAPSNREERISVRKRVKELLHRVAFAYEDPEARRGVYENPVIQRITNEMWFANQKDEGVAFPRYFSPRLPLTTLALILTVIQNVLEEWMTGKRKSIHFTRKLYQEKLEAHLSSLEDFSERTKRYRILPTILTAIITHACENADALFEEDETATRLDEEDVENAVKDWMEQHGLLEHDSDEDEVNGGAGYQHGKNDIRRSGVGEDGTRGGPEGDDNAGDAGQMNED